MSFCDMEIKNNIWIYQWDDHFTEKILLEKFAVSHLKLKVDNCIVQRNVNYIDSQGFVGSVLLNSVLAVL